METIYKIGEYVKVLYRYNFLLSVYEPEFYGMITGYKKIEDREYRYVAGELYGQTELSPISTTELETYFITK